jgi:hypothetical protein
MDSSTSTTNQLNHQNNDPHSDDSVDNSAVSESQQLIFNPTQLAGSTLTSGVTLIHNPIPLQFVPAVSYGAAPTQFVQGKDHLKASVL